MVAVWSTVITDLHLLAFLLLLVTGAVCQDENAVVGEPFVKHSSSQFLQRETIYGRENRIYSNRWLFDLTPAEGNWESTDLSRAVRAGGRLERAGPGTMGGLCFTQNSFVCAADAIYVKFKTNATFGGHVSVKFTPSRFCYQTLVTNNQIEVLIPHEECAVNRRKVFNPDGLILEATVSVSFHPDFTTASDRLFHVNCYHQRGKDGLKAGTPSAPQEKTQNGPSCEYGIFETRGGPLAGTVALGQSVYHEWKCSNVQNNYLLVKNCVLVAGDSRHSVIDSDGCSKDIFLLPQLAYENQSYVSQNVSVFGVSSSSLVFFECELHLLPSTNGLCPTPECSLDREKRAINTSTLLEVRSQRLEISELDKYEYDVSHPSQVTTCEAQPTISDEDAICVSTSSVVIVSCLFLTSSLIAVSLASLAVLRRYRHYNVATARA